jgi:hypothetical protein
MARGTINHRFIRILRLYPLALAVLLGLAYVLGGFSDRPDAILHKNLTYTLLTIVLAVVPIAFMIAFVVIGNSSDRKYLKSLRGQEGFEYGSAFDLPSEEMHGYKIAQIRGIAPTLTGISGDPYKVDDSARCELNPDHVPPVQGCQCGFHAFKDRGEAAFELTLHAKTFLLDVDLFGLGFVYSRGFRAESQVVNTLFVPKRCMNCKVLPVSRFISRYIFSPEFQGWWQWEVRCRVCSSATPAKNRMEIGDMQKLLEVGFERS